MAARVLRFKNESEFNSYLEEIDAGMRKDNVPIVARPMTAFSRISAQYDDKIEFNISEAMNLHKNEIIEYEGDALTRRIIDWFDDLYGDRLKLNFAWGKSAAIIRNDAYIMNIPIFIGDVEYTYDVKTLGQSGRTKENGQTIVNVFDCFPEITEATVARISRSDGLRLANELKANTDRYYKATEINKYEGTFDVRVDLDSSAQQMVGGQASLGFSRWHSLQAAEKALKSILSCQNLSFPRSHDLLELVHASDMVGVSPLSLKNATCSPSVRYEPELSSLTQAMDTHHAALDICLEAAERIALVGKRIIDK